MSDILKIVFSLSLSGSLLIIVLFLCKPFYRNRISKRWQYYIWLVVIVRLLLPFAPEQNLVGTMFDRAELLTVQNDSAFADNINGMDGSLEDTENSVTAVEQDGLSEYGNNAAGIAGEDAAQISANESNMISKVKENIWQYLWLIWLGGAAVLLIRKVTMYQHFVKFIKAGREEVSDIKLLDILAETGEQIGLKRPVGLYRNEFVSSPLLFGFFHPCVILPTVSLSETDFRYTIRHELIHCKRCDILYKWLVQATICLHWFNPFVWLMGRELGQACELACDEALMGTLDEQERKAYGDTLLRAIENGGKRIYKESALSVTLSENGKALKERLKAIIHFKKPSKTALAISFILVAGIMSGAVMTGAVSPAKVTGKMEIPEEIDRSEESAQTVSDISVGEEEVFMETLEFDGTVYYLVFNEAQLRSIGTGEYGLDKDYMQQADIEMSREEWIPIGTKDEPFTGSYNGNGYEIAGLTMTDPDAELAGLFGAAEGAHLYNITMRNIDISSAGRNRAGMSAGAIVAYNMGPDGRVYDNRVYLPEESVTVTGMPGADSGEAASKEKESATAVQGTDSEEAASGAEEYYENGSLPGFERAFSSLNEKQQKAWLEKIYDDGEIAFFSVGLRQLNADSPLIENFSQKAYEEGKVGFFSVLTDNMKEDRLEYWLDRALEDEKINFQSVLFTALGRDEEMEAIEEELERQREEEYESVGVIVNGKKYYYQGQLVNIFYDRQPDNAFYMLNMNPAGTVNIKIVRGADGKIIKAEYMTEEEVAEMIVQ